MGFQFSTAARNAALDAIETTAGASAILKIFNGTLPSNCAAADSGTTLVTMALPADWLADAADGSKAMSGTWQELAADAAGTAKYFR
ncbi:hypothetical protein FGG78_44040, partial [Thioclava sp. BHET1]